MFADAVTDEWWGPGAFDALPAHANDYDAGALFDVLFQDHDILLLFGQQFDGIEHPDDPINQMMGIGDYRPAAWFTTFGNCEPR